MPYSGQSPNRRRFLGWLLSAAGCSLAGTARPTLSAAAVDSDGPPVGEPWPRTESAVTTSADGTPIFCRRGGSGDVTVLFLHGWSCNHRFFGPQFAAVGRQYQFLALDLAGHGLSGARETHSVPAFADDVLAVADLVSGPLVLVAHSAGGRIACASAARLGDRLLGMVGIDSFQNLGLPAPSPEQVAASLAAMRSDFRGQIDRSLAMFFPAEADPALVAWVEGQMKSMAPEQAIAAVAAFARFDAGAAIAGYDRPVLALNGDGVPTQVEAIRALIPGFEAQILSGQGHFPQLYDPASFNHLLRDTLQRITTTNRAGGSAGSGSASAGRTT